MPKPAPSVMVWVTVPSSLKTAPYKRFRLPVLGSGQLEEQVQVPKAGHYMTRMDTRPILDCMKIYCACFERFSAQKKETEFRFLTFSKLFLFLIGFCWFMLVLRGMLGT